MSAPNLRFLLIITGCCSLIILLALLFAMEGEESLDRISRWMNAHFFTVPVTSTPTPQPLRLILPSPLPMSTLDLQTRLRSKPLTTESWETVMGSLWQDGEYVNVANNFEDLGDIVLDRATGLMWQKSGSEDAITYEHAQMYIEHLNGERFAGNDDWRLPTIPELLSILEPEKQPAGFYLFSINPIFERTQSFCWSADRRISDEYPSEPAAWSFYFRSGAPRWYGLDYFHYVRAVRSWHTP